MSYNNQKNNNAIQSTPPQPDGIPTPLADKIIWNPEQILEAKDSFVLLLLEGNNY